MNVKSGRCWRMLWPLALLFVVGLGAPSAPAQAPATMPAPPATPAGEKRVTNLWVETDLRQVVQDISAQTDTVILCDVTVQGLISMAVKDMPLPECLERICASGGYSFVLVKDYYLIGRADPGNPLFQRVSDPQRVKLSHITPDQVRALLHASLIPYVNFDRASGTVIVTAPEPLRQRILAAVKLVDQPNQQVAIEAVVFELTESGSKQLALDWQFHSGNVTGGATDLVSTISFGPHSDLGTYVNLTLRAIVEARRGQVLANPRILVLNNTDAEIFVGQEKYFTLLSGQASNPYYTLQSIKAGVTLKVAPYIGENGQITLGLEPEVSDVVTEASDTTTRQGDTTAPLPVVTRRHAKTVINIQDGETVLLGGLLREQNRSVTDKVPLVGDIPGLGAAFSKVSKQKEQQEVVILITAHIANTKAAGAEKLSARLEQRYITPLDAILASQQGCHK